MVESTQTKMCCVCGEVKVVTQFSPVKKRPGTFEGRCRACKQARVTTRRRSDRGFAEAEKARLRKWRAANRDELNSVQRARRGANREASNAYQREWRAAQPPEARRRRLDVMAAGMRRRREDPEAAARARAARRVYVLTNPEKIRAARQRYEQQNRDAVRERKRAYAKANEKRIREYRRAYQQANPERKAANARRWLEANPERAREQRLRRRALIRKTRVGPVDLKALWTGVCALCGETMDPTLKRPDMLSKSVDHIIPLSRGGTHTQDNLQYAHLMCNMRKGVQLPATLAA